MECNEWTEKGLLYVFNELDESEIAPYERHCASCVYCRDEIARFRYEHKHIFTPDIFEMTPSEAVDKEILRVCTKPIRPVTSIIHFTSFYKNAVVGLLLLAVGFGGGIYFGTLKTTHDMQNARIKGQENMAVQNSSGAMFFSSNTTSSANTEAALRRFHDSLGRKGGDSNRQLQNIGDPTTRQRVMPVDLKNE